MDDRLVHRRKKWIFSGICLGGIGVYYYHCGVVGHRLVECTNSEAVGARKRIAKLAGEKEGDVLKVDLLKKRGNYSS